MAHLHLSAREAAQLGLEKPKPKTRATRTPSQPLSATFAQVLQNRFPGVFAPIPTLGIHWGDRTRQLGVQWGGLVRTEANAAWVIVPVWGQDVETKEGLIKTLERIEEIREIVEEESHGRPRADLSGSPP